MLTKSIRNFSKSNKMVDKWSIIYFMGCTLGWGFSTFIMGFLGKEDISYETAMFYQSIGAALVGSSVIFKVNFGLTSNHLLAICNGIAFSMADLAYYMVCFIFVNYQQFSYQDLE